MAQTDALLGALKSALKSQRKTYRDVAVALDLSEASVKRLFSEQNLSLARLDAICGLLEMEISDLVQLMNAQASAISHLSDEQEEEIVSDLRLLLVTVCVLNRWTFEDIVGGYVIDTHEAIRHLARLDRLKVIDLLPGNRIKLRVAPNFAWLENGPIQRFFRERLGAEYFKRRFDRGDEKLIVINGMLSKHANAVFQRKMQKLARDFDELNDNDASLPLDQRHGATVVIAMRHWEFELFATLRRP